MCVYVFGFHGRLSDEFLTSFFYVFHYILRDLIMLIIIILVMIILYSWCSFSYCFVSFLLFKCCFLCKPNSNLARVCMKVFQT